MRTVPGGAAADPGGAQEKTGDSGGWLAGWLVGWQAVTKYVRFASKLALMVVVVYVSSTTTTAEEQEKQSPQLPRSSESRKRTNYSRGGRGCT